MPSIPIIMPQLGESIAEAAIINFLVKPGDTSTADQDLIEVETNKATMTVTSPCSGRVEKFTVQLNESYAVGDVLGQIEVTDEEAARLGLDVPAPGKHPTRNPTPGPSPNPGRTSAAVAWNPPCAACPCRPTRRVRVIFRRGSRRAWTNSVCTPPTWRASPAAVRPGA